MDKKRWILFLGYGANNLERIAQAFAERMNENPEVGVIAASMAPPAENPRAARVLSEAGIPLPTGSHLSLLEIEPFTFDLTVTLGDFDQSCRPNLPGMPPHFHWDTPDPAPGTPEEASLEMLRKARELVRQKVATLFDSKLLDALFITRKNLMLVLDNLMDGVMAHTARRRIFYFNTAAEKITGYRREDILGKDCHEVFPGRFCGGNCEFCDTSEQGEKGISRRQMSFTRRDGKKALLRMSILPLTGEDGTGLGAMVTFKDDTELVRLKDRLTHHHSLGGLVGKDPKMLAVFDQIREVAAFNASVLILGESGTGKELVASAVHDLSPRAKKPFVAVNCGALPEGILESELFGHVRGAFSGAVADKKGRFELADGGTLFLDEVAELSPAMQVKLLRVLQEQRFFRVGGEKPVTVDVRIISATNRDLRKMVEKRQFRRDLFYRLCVVPLTVPPLREKRMDIPMLVEHFLDLVARETGRPRLSPGHEVSDLFAAYDWPGNVRELHNAIEYAYVKCRTGIIEKENLPPEILKNVDAARDRKEASARLTREQILAATARAKGNRKETARLLGVGRATLYRYLEHFGLK
ncbi:MAG: sigma 54-interacting transcriptional regulator [Thermodesulfobacteriota bacterium]